MIKTTSFTPKENIDLTKEISLVHPLDTPFMTYVMGKGQFEDSLSTIITWREKSLDTTTDISHAEGSETDAFQSSGRAEKSNVMEIFKKAVNVSGSAQASTVTGINDLLAEEINDRMIEMKVQIEKALINGVKNDGSSSPFVRRMRGILDFAHEDNLTTGSFNEESFKGTIRNLWTNGLGANEYVCMVNADLKESIDSWYKDSYSYNAPMNEFGIVANKIITNYGNVKLILNRHMPTDKLVVFDPSYIEFGFLRKPFAEMLSKTGDSAKAQVISELSLKVLNEKAVAVLTVA